jgi:hypothetical protein
MFYGEKLLTTGNPDVVRDQALFARLGLKAEGAIEDAASCGIPCASDKSLKPAVHALSARDAGVEA